MGEVCDISVVKNFNVEEKDADTALLCENPPKNLLHLPPELLFKVLEKMPYDAVAKARMVCRTFNNVCAEVLNLGFKKTVARHKAITKRIKSQLPRRESERRGHILARHSDVLHSIETRLSMLTLTYGKCIEMKLCCFVPGRVLDEMNNVLNVIDMQARIWRPHDVLQELRDISSMAIDHFEENIAGELKKTYLKIMKSDEEAPKALSYDDANKRFKKYKWAELDKEFKTLFSITSPAAETLKLEPILLDSPVIAQTVRTPLFVTTSMLQNAISPLAKLQLEHAMLKKKLSVLKQNEEKLVSEAKYMRHALHKDRKKMRKFEMRLKKLELANGELRSEIFCLRRGAATENNATSATNATNAVVSATIPPASTSYVSIESSSADDTAEPTMKRQRTNK